MIDKNSIEMLIDLKIEELAEIVRRQDCVTEYNNMSFDMRLQFAISELHAMKMNESFKRLVANARFKYPKARFTDIAYLPERNLDRLQLTQIATGNFLEYATNIATYGVTGSGKSYISCCIGTMACSHGKRTLFYRMPDMLTDFDCLETAQQRKRFISKLTRIDLLIIDEWLGVSLSEKHINLIFEIVEKRNEVRSTVFCSQYAPEDWYVRLGESTQCESILNRIFSGLCKINCGSLNMREVYSESKLRI